MLSIFSKQFINITLLGFLLLNHVQARIHYHQYQRQQQPAQQSFIDTTATLSEARFVLGATSSNELVFFGGGATSLTSGSTDRVDILNVTSDSWTTTTLSIPRIGLAVTSSGNLVFFAGGGNLSYINIQSNNFTGNATDRVDVYNTSNNSWYTATLSQARATLAATSVGNLILFGGGYDPNGSKESKVVDIYNVTNNTWTNATLSQARYTLAATSVASRYALFAGGRFGSKSSNVVDMFDSLSGMWRTSTLSQARDFLAATSLNNLAFFGGGYNESESNVVDIFNSTSQTWSTATLSHNRALLAAASIGDIVVFGGGSPDGFTASAVVDVYNVTSNLWFTVNLSQPRAGLAATSTSSTSTNKIFFGGGLSNTGPSNIVDIFDFDVSSPQLTTTSPMSQSSPSDSTTISVVIGVIVVIVILGVVMVVVFLFVRYKIRKMKKVQIQLSQPQAQQQQQREKIGQQGSLSRISEFELLRKTQISFTELVVEREIGEGSYGRVYLGTWNGAPVALKFCPKKAQNEDFFSEVRILLQLPPHPNVIQMFGICELEQELVLVLEYCNGGSLDHLLFYDQRRLSITNDQKMELVQGIARGVLHLHKHNIVHRDLAARNILLASSGIPKLSDFGTSRILEKSDYGQTKTNIGPVCWMAPESIALKAYSKKSDVWSFGIVVY
jgi:predicted Ser/Thr protein kinase